CAAYTRYEETGCHFFLLLFPGFNFLVVLYFARSLSGLFFAYSAALSFLLSRSAYTHGGSQYARAACVAKSPAELNKAPAHLPWCLFLRQSRQPGYPTPRGHP